MNQFRFSVLAPAGWCTAAVTPWAAAMGQQVVVDHLNAEIHKALATDIMKKHFADFGAEAAPVTPDAFSAKVKNEIASWRKVIIAADIKAE